MQCGIECEQKCTDLFPGARLSRIFGGEIGGVLNSSAMCTVHFGIGGENDIHHLIVIQSSQSLAKQGNDSNEPYCALEASCG